jgi:phosphoglycolate phosphatase
VDEIRQMVGDGVVALVERGFRWSGAPPDPAAVPRLVRRFLELYAGGGHARTRPYPGVAATLAELGARGCRLAVCTNKPIALTRQVLDAVDLAGLFGAVTGGDSLPVRKPHPGHLLGTLDLLGASPAEAVMVGDSGNDVAVARAAGVPAVVVSWGYTRVPAAELGGDLLIDDFTELLRLLET